MALNPALAPEIGPDGLSREAPIIAYTEKIIQEEQLQLRKYIEENYSKIRDVERELAGLTMEMKLTAGPKKAALELLRKKIEASTEKIRAAKLKEEEARKVWEAASKVVKDEEAVKQKLCEDLTKLVQESSNSQYARLEELKRRLEALNPRRSSATPPLSDVKAADSAQYSTPSDAAVVLSSDEANSVQGNGKPMSVTNDNPAVGSETKGKKKVHFQVKGKGIGAVPKSKNSSVPGWTGAGFDVVDRT